MAMKPWVTFVVSLYTFSFIKILCEFVKCKWYLIFAAPVLFYDELCRCRTLDSGHGPPCGCPRPISILMWQGPHMLLRQWLTRSTSSCLHRQIVSTLTRKLSHPRTHEKVRWSDYQPNKNNVHFIKPVEDGGGYGNSHTCYHLREADIGGATVLGETRHIFKFSIP